MDIGITSSFTKSIVQYLFRICDSSVVTIPHGAKLLLHFFYTQLPHYCTGAPYERNQPPASHLPRAARSGSKRVFRCIEGKGATQNTVPSLTISIGGPPPDSGLFSLAISLPPFHVALSSTCARVSWSFDKPSLTRICSATRSLMVWFGVRVQAHGAPGCDSAVVVVRVVNEMMTSSGW